MSQVRRQFDVDIDIPSKVDRTQFGVRAMVYNETTMRVLPHPSGVYLEKVPVDALTGNASFDYKKGEELGLMKVDILTNTTYNNFRTKEELLDAIDREPRWKLLEDKRIVETLPHVSNHYDDLREFRPKSIEELADFLALIRPAKVHMLGEYRKDTAGVRRRLYQRPSNGIYFKKSHAISYALMIVAVLNKVHDGGIVW